MAETFTVQSRRQAAGVILDLGGDIDLQADATFESAFRQALADHPEVVVLNFTQVHYINSSGIAILVSLLAHARQAGCRLVVYGLSEHYLEIFELTRLSEYMAVFQDEAAALAVQ